MALGRLWVVWRRDFGSAHGNHDHTRRVQDSDTRDGHTSQPPTTPKSATMVQNVSADLVWEVTRNTSAFLLKRKQGGGVQFSRDPLNLTNKHARKVRIALPVKHSPVQSG